METFEEKKKKHPTLTVMDRQNTKWAKEISGKCKHKWQPLSFIFETQLLDKEGRVRIKQPDLNNARIYCVCMKCCSHTYIETGYVGYFIGSPDLLEEKKEKNNV